MKLRGSAAIQFCGDHRRTVACLCGLLFALPLQREKRCLIEFFSVGLSESTTIILGARSMEKTRGKSGKHGVDDVLSDNR